MDPYGIKVLRSDWEEDRSGVAQGEAEELLRTAMVC